MGFNLSMQGIGDVVIVGPAAGRFFRRLARPEVSQGLAYLPLLVFLYLLLFRACASSQPFVRLLSLLLRFHLSFHELPEEASRKHGSRNWRLARVLVKAT